MIYREFGRTGWKVSAIGLGTWNIGNQWGEVDEDTARATILSALDKGVNLFDTAESYGNPNGLSEQRLGKALVGTRHRVHIVTKIGNWGKRTGQEVPMTTVDMVRLCVHASLYRLRTDWIDVVLCHRGDLEDPAVFLEGFENLKQNGSIREFGISTDSLEVLKRFNRHGTCSVVELDYSLLNRQAEEEILPYCREHGVAVLIRGPLAQGLLSGNYAEESVFTDSVREKWNKEEKARKSFMKQVAEVAKLKAMLNPGQEMVETALRFAYSHRVQPVAIPGAKSPYQAAMNAAAGNKPMEEWERRKLMDCLAQ